MRVAQYPRAEDGTPLDLLGAVLTDPTGNGGAKTPVPRGPDDAKLDTVGLVVTDKLGNSVDLAIGLKYYATRAAIAALVSIGIPSGTSAYLSETGREGVFSWNPANLAADITSDPQQGLYIAPASDPTGASGAWVRGYDFDASVLWWGATPGLGDTSAAVEAARVALAVVNGSQVDVTNRGMTRLYFPSKWGHYNMGSYTVQPNTPLYWYGDYSGLGDQAGGTRLKWTGDVPGIILNGWDGVNFNAQGSTIRNMLIVGPLAPTLNFAAHGISGSALITLRDLTIYGFSGDGLHQYSSAGALLGNANGCRVDNISVYSCRWGFYFDGPDTNACTYTHLYAISNRLGGIRDNSFLGNVVFGALLEDNGPNTTFHSRCSFGGNQYVVALGQEAFCAANAPTGAATSNAGWLYLQAGGPSAVAPAWAGGQTWYFGAPIAIVDANNGGNYFGIYAEGGQNPAINGGRALIKFQQMNVLMWNSIGQACAYEFMENGWVKYEYLRAGAGGFDCLGAATISGNVNILAGKHLQFNSGTNYATHLWGSSGFITELYDAGAASYQPYNLNISALKLSFDGGATQPVQLDVNGLKVANVKVVGTQGAAVADVAAITSIAGVNAGVLTAANVGAPAAVTTSNAVNAVAAPTQAEFNAFVAKFNQAVTDITNLRASVASLVTELNKEETDMATVRTALNTLVTTFNQDRTDTSNVRTVANTILARVRAGTGHGLIV